MSTGTLPGPRRHRCPHGRVLPSAAQHHFIAQSLAHQDFGSAIAASVDWCDICTGLVDAQQPAERPEVGKAR